MANAKFIIQFRKTYSFGSKIIAVSCRFKKKKTDLDKQHLNLLYPEITIQHDCALKIKSRQFRCEFEKRKRWGPKLPHQRQRPSGPNAKTLGLVRAPATSPPLPSRDWLPPSRCGRVCWWSPAPGHINRTCLVLSSQDKPGREKCVKKEKYNLSVAETNLCSKSIFLQWELLCGSITYILSNNYKTGVTKLYSP